MKDAFASPPQGLLKVLLEAPRLLFRCRLGWLLDHRFLMLTHRGRHSGRIYQSVLEVSRYDPVNQESVVVSGWGDQADWYRNLRASGALMIDIGGRRYPADVRFLTPPEVYTELQGYLRRNPWSTGVARRLFGLQFDGSPSDLENADKLRGIAFVPTSR